MIVEHVLGEVCAPPLGISGKLIHRCGSSVDLHDLQDPAILVDAEEIKNKELLNTICFQSPLQRQTILSLIFPDLSLLFF